MTDNISSSQYINDCHRNFSMYVLQTRAFPTIADGLKAGGRRLIWTARNGEKFKTATLAGATMPLHPHGDASDTIDTLAKPYGNNMPIFEGIGSFGTRLKPNATGAPRYTSVKVSAFTKAVLFADIELVEMVDNYDGTLQEPSSFLPLVPIGIINPSEGIGVGFKSTILPRSLGDVVDSQLAHLAGKKFNDPPITFTPFGAVSTESEVIKSGNTRYWFEGEFLRVDSSNVHIGNIPYGLDHAQLVEHLNGLIEVGVIVSYEDHSSNEISIAVKFPRGALKAMTDEQIQAKLKLRASLTEVMNMVDFSGTKVIPMTYADTITQFTDWRLQWYLNRYQLLAEKVRKDIQRYKDIILAIKNDVGGKGRKIGSRSELTEWLGSIGVVYTDYIADMPIYRVTLTEVAKAQEKLDAAMIVLAEHERMIADPEARRKVYMQELKDVKKQFHIPIASSGQVKTKKKATA